MKAAHTRILFLLIAGAAGALGYGVAFNANRPVVELHYSPAENLEPIDVALIASARRSIDMDAYVLTDWPIIDALADAAARGVRVRIWREPTTADYAGPAALAKLSQTPWDITLRVKPAGDLMHLKSYCIDGVTLRTGAANFSASGEARQDNDLVILRDPALAEAFEANFARHWGAK